jgi:hypothetical protein
VDLQRGSVFSVDAGESATRTHCGRQIFFVLKKKLRVHSTALEKAAMTVVIEERARDV